MRGPNSEQSNKNVPESLKGFSKLITDEMTRTPRKEQPGSSDDARESSHGKLIPLGHQNVQVGNRPTKAVSPSSRQVQTPNETPNASTNSPGGNTLSNPSIQPVVKKSGLSKPAENRLRTITDDDMSSHLGEKNVKSSKKESFPSFEDSRNKAKAEKLNNVTSLVNQNKIYGKKDDDFDDILDDF